MKTLHFVVTARATPEKVRDTMLEQESYRIWTAEFMQGSYYEVSWGKGDRIRFLAPNDSGMNSIIEDSLPYEYVSITHVGVIVNGAEDTECDESRKRASARELHAFKEVENATAVSVACDVLPEYESYMSDVWPRALKELCEA